MRMQRHILRNVGNISFRHLHQQSFYKPKVVIVGSGWSGFRCATEISKDKYDVQIVSPRNHFLFTPLLPSTAVGTLEFRCIQEPVRTIPGISYIQASCQDVDFEKKILKLKHEFNDHEVEKSYDYLILCPGSESATFGIKGVLENPNVHFLKQLSDSRKIRNDLLKCFERASASDIDDEERQRLLTFVVVGGGPTCVEFTSELYDFVKGDVTRWYPDLHRFIRVVLVEASDHILSSFKSTLGNYVESLFHNRKILVMKGTKVKEIMGHTAQIEKGGISSNLPFGLMVWSTGIKQTLLIENISSSVVAKSKNGRLCLDKYLRVLQPAPVTKEVVGNTAGAVHAPIANGSVFAMGDCAGDVVRPLPALAQVAGQQGKYLADVFNESKGNVITATTEFQYTHLGSMASVGQWKGVYDSTSLDGVMYGPPVKGFLAFVLWRSAYWTKSVSLVNKILIPMYWFKSAVFGRDISRF